MTSPVGEMSARAIRQARARRLAVRFALWVGLPTLLSAFYYGCIVHSQFESRAVVLVQSRDRDVAGVDSNTKVDAGEAHLVVEYIRSRAMSEFLTAESEFALHYQSDDVDWFSRLDEDAGPDEIHDLYTDVVKAQYHSNSKTIQLRVRAYSAEAAQRFTKAILQATQRKLDDLYSGSRRERMLSVVVEPSLPSAATYPKRAWSVATVFVVALVLMGIFGLLAAAVREHAKF